MRSLAARLALLLVLTAAAAGPLQGQRGSYEYLQAFSAVLNHVRSNYVDSVGYPELVRAGIEGVLRSLDPHSYYVSRDEWQRRTALERGELAVTGLRLEDLDSAVVVQAVIPDSPADKAGIWPGDRLRAIDDTAVAGLRANALELRLAGGKGSRVRVTLERGPTLAPDTLALTLRREFLKERSLGTTGMVEPGTGFVRLAQFGPGAADEVERAIKALQKAGARQVILDLRGNPGGIVVEAVDLAGLFLPKGSLIFRTRGRKAAADEDYLAKRDGPFRDLPLIVLIDERSASASEASAGALQDNDRALLVGRRSFGKALMQTLFLVPPTGDNVWLTIGWVSTPSGRVIQRRYRGLGYQQYRSLAGSGGAGADTAEVFHTRRGRVVRGGGGLAPDLTVPGPQAPPVWWSLASDSGWVAQVTDSTAQALAATPLTAAQWRADPTRWRPALTALEAKVRAGLGVEPQPEASVAEALARLLAARVAELRWPPDGARDFRLATDPGVRAALDAFPRLSALLAAPAAGTGLP